jgi:hypothetical protein
MSGLRLPANMDFLITALVLFGQNTLPFREKSRSGATREFGVGAEKDLVEEREKRNPA